MINSFKNFERLRYRISNDIKGVIADGKSNKDNLKEEITNTIFATVFSAFITEVSFGNNVLTLQWRVFLLIPTFIILYIISFLLYNSIYKRIVAFREKRKVHHINSDVDALMQRIKDYDNIACDSILVAKDFKMAYEKLEDDKNLKVFYLFEVMHYLETACEKTFALVEKRDKCIRTTSHNDGVDEFRVINIVKIMREIDDFLKLNLLIWDEYANQKDAIIARHNYIIELIAKIEKSIGCNL